MKKIKTQTVKMTVDAEVLPLSSALVARIVKVGTNLDKVVARINDNGSIWTEDDDNRAINDANTLLMDIYYAFTGEDEKKESEATDEPIGTREQPKQPKF